MAYPGVNRALDEMKASMEHEEAAKTLLMFSKICWKKERLEKMEKGEENVRYLVAQAVGDPSSEIIARIAWEKETTESPTISRAPSPSYASGSKSSLAPDRSKLPTPQLMVEQCKGPEEGWYREISNDEVELRVHEHCGYLDDELVRCRKAFRCGAVHASIQRSWRQLNSIRDEDRDPMLSYVPGQAKTEQDALEKLRREFRKRKVTPAARRDELLANWNKAIDTFKETGQHAFPRGFDLLLHGQRGKMTISEYLALKNEQSSNGSQSQPTPVPATGGASELSQTVASPTGRSHQSPVSTARRKLSQPLETLQATSTANAQPLASKPQEHSRPGPSGKKPLAKTLPRTMTQPSPAQGEAKAWVEPEGALDELALMLASLPSLPENTKASSVGKRKKQPTQKAMEAEEAAQAERQAKKAKKSP